MSISRCALLCVCVLLVSAQIKTIAKVSEGDRSNSQEISTAPPILGIRARPATSSLRSESEQNGQQTDSSSIPSAKVKQNERNSSSQKEKTNGKQQDQDNKQEIQSAKVALEGYKLMKKANWKKHHGFNNDDLHFHWRREHQFEDDSSQETEDSSEDISHFCKDE